MNEIIAKLQETFSDPQLWSKPATWIAVACGVIALLLVVRLMFRRKKPSARSRPLWLRRFLNRTRKRESSARC